MKVNLTLTDAETIRDYHEDGVCVVRNLIPPEWIERMGEAVDRRPEGIQGHPPRIAGHKWVLLLREGVVKAQGHGALSNARQVGDPPF